MYKKIQKLWEGRIKRKNFNITFFILQALFIITILLPKVELINKLLSEYKFFDILLITLSLGLIIIFYILLVFLTLRRAMDVGLSNKFLIFLKTLYFLQVIGIILFFMSSFSKLLLLFGYISLNVISVVLFPITLYLVFKNSETKDNMYGKYEKVAPRPYFKDVLNLV